MSRVAKSPVSVPAGVEVSISGRRVRIKGARGTVERETHELAEVRHENGEIRVRAASAAKTAEAIAGTERALLRNMTIGVSAGFQRKLDIVGVGYRAQVQGRSLNLTLGFSHPISYSIPEGITIETPSVTEILVKGTDKQQVGQVAAEIRAYRPPEPYKGKGVRYSDEVLLRKEAKKT
ncbi:MAG: 50S ribosomal protein L6 [Gammaproteobacteria bacterium]|nr:50S ribosomal protein L6 [Gammaproteobacteria bacterium]